VTLIRNTLAFITINQTGHFSDYEVWRFVSGVTLRLARAHRITSSVITSSTFKGLFPSVLLIM